MDLSPVTLWSSYFTFQLKLRILGIVCVPSELFKFYLRTEPCAVTQIHLNLKKRGFHALVKSVLERIGRKDFRDGGLQSVPRSDLLNYKQGGSHLAHRRTLPEEGSDCRETH